MLTFKVLAALLSYPDEALIGAIPEMMRALNDEALLKPRERAALNGLLSELASDDLLDLQEGYTALFDRTRSLSLHLFEHVHGESRARGQAMVDLRNLYASHGLMLSVNELPDYLPVFLEFLSQRPLSEAREMLSDTVHILREVGNRLASRGSGYAAVFDTLLVLAGEAGLDISRPGSTEQQEEDLLSLDNAWEDAPVTFGPGAGQPQEAVIRVYPRRAA